MDNDKKLTKLAPLISSHSFFETNKNALAPPNSVDMLKAPKQRHRKSYNASDGVPSKINLIYALRKSHEEANHEEGSAKALVPVPPPTQVDAPNAKAATYKRPTSARSSRYSLSALPDRAHTASPTLNEVIKKIESVAREQASACTEGIETIFPFAKLN